jgi:hypothetical protein
LSHPGLLTKASWYAAISAIRASGIISSDIVISFH